jgi:hypothetical protein
MTNHHGQLQAHMNNKSFHNINSEMFMFAYIFSLSSNLECGHGITNGLVAICEE